MSRWCNHAYRLPIASSSWLREHHSFCAKSHIDVQVMRYSFDHALYWIAQDATHDVEKRTSMQPYDPSPEEQQQWTHYQQPYGPGYPPVIYQVVYQQPALEPPDYMGSAFLILFLYWLGYFPGLIVNIFKLMQAFETQAQYGRAPGLGCLLMTLVAPFLGFGMLFFLVTHIFPGR